MQVSSERSALIERLLGWGAAACLVLAALAVAGGLTVGFVLVWGGQVMPSWAVSAVLLAISLALVGARTLMRKHRARRSDEHGPPARRAAGWTAAWVTGAASVALGSALGLAADQPATYTVLASSGPGTCQVAVRESSFLFAGAGDAYAVGPGGLGRPVGSWTADDGYQPIASGTYDLEWDDGSAVLSLHSDVGNPVWPASHFFDCP